MSGGECGGGRSKWADHGGRHARDCVADNHILVWGTGGASVSADTLLGPEFVLTQPMKVTEIGAFIDNCGSIVMGVPMCPNTLPLIVRVDRPSRAFNGTPDPNPRHALATFTLSDDKDPLTYSYESVQPNIVLAAGGYFALFGARGADVATLLAGSAGPPVYDAGWMSMGGLTPGRSWVEPYPGAVRILGIPTWWTRGQ